MKHRKDTRPRTNLTRYTLTTLAALTLAGAGVFAMTSPAFASTDSPLHTVADFSVAISGSGSAGIGHTYFSEGSGGTGIGNLHAPLTGSGSAGIYSCPDGAACIGVELNIPIHGSGSYSASN